MSDVIQVVCIIVDGSNVTLYKPDGSNIIIPQNDPRTKVANKVVAELERCKAQGVPVICDVALEDLTVKSHYTDAEKQLGGAVRFFRAVKSKLAEIMAKFSDDELEPTQVGDVPVPKQTYTPETQPQNRSQAAVAEIMANAHATDSPGFHVPESADTTVVAITEDGTIIPGMEMISTQLQAIALGLGNAIGATAFFKRLASVKHAHSVQDLLRFMEKGELPIADDGTILAYKRLRKTGVVKGVFVDEYSKLVKQRLGSHVFMAPSLVDHNRSQDCSNGLHVARRDYLSSFSGDVTVLIKLAPEDVIAVPHGDARKLRACGYHIVAVLSPKDAGNVNNNRPLENTNLLGDVVAGNHIGVIETVEIINQSRNPDSVKITQIGFDPEYVNVPSGRVAESLDHMEVPPEEERTSVDPRQIALAEKPKPEELAVLPVAKVSKLQQMIIDFQDGAPEQKYALALALKDFKKVTKKSWTALGIDVGMVDEILTLTQPRPAVAAPVVADVPPVKKAKKGKDLSEKLNKTTRNIGPITPVKPAKAKPTVKAAGKAPSKAEQIRELLNKPPTKVNAQQILDLKKQAKKGWEALGVTDAEVTNVLRLVQ